MRTMRYVRYQIQLLLHAPAVTAGGIGCWQQHSDLIVPAVACAIANCHKEVSA